MARAPATFREACPFWSSQAMQCQLCREGLFIPLNDHIEMYCQTFHHPQCQQFSLQSSPQMQAVGKVRPNRRKYERMAINYRVSIAATKHEITAAFRLHTLLSPAIGRTFSLSKGGMGIITERPLPQASAVRFAFDDSFPESILSGGGRVAWCRQGQTRQYHAGVAFQDHRYIERMGLYLGLISTIPSATGE